MYAAIGGSRSKGERSNLNEEQNWRNTCLEISRGTGPIDMEFGTAYFLWDGLFFYHLAVQLADLDPNGCHIAGAGAGLLGSFRWGFGAFRGIPRRMLLWQAP